VRERNIMLLHYATGLGILVFGAVHVFVVFFTYPLQGTIWETTLKFDNIPFAILPVYRNAILAASLWGLLLCTTIHSMNGLRVIFLELLGERAAMRVVSRVLYLVGAIIMIYGTRTIIVANMIT
jgi:Succinate dehydrogenase/Fumarate reductase transmembrane subunit.